MCLLVYMDTFFSLNEGQQMTTTCKDMSRPIRIECEKHFLSGDISLSLEPTHLISKQKDCQEKSIENDLNTFCRNVTKSDLCEFNMSDFMIGYKDCYVTSKTITVTYQCRGKCFYMREPNICIRTRLEHSYKCISITSTRLTSISLNIFDSANFISMMSDNNLYSLSIILLLW